MQSHQGVIDQTLEELPDQINVETPDQGTTEIKVKNQPGSPGQINHHARQGLVKWHIGVTIAANPFFIANRLGKGLPQRNADVFDSMVRIDMQIAFSLDLKVDQAVTGYLIQHVIQKRNARRENATPRSIEIKTNRHLGFQGISADFGLPHAHLNAVLQKEWMGAPAKAGQVRINSSSQHDTISGLDCIQTACHHDHS